VVERWRKGENLAVNLHRDDSCGSVPPHGAAELAQPDEPGL
jgi:hypothetical protein